MFRSLTIEKDDGKRCAVARSIGRRPLVMIEFLLQSG